MSVEGAVAVGVVRILKGRSASVEFGVLLREEPQIRRKGAREWYPLVVPTRLRDLEVGKLTKAELQTSATMELPLPVLAVVLGHLPIEAAYLARTSRAFNKAFRDEMVWKGRAMRVNPEKAAA